ncbi:MAG TPA: class I adenylate-forming enzyme family protein [Magnetospirillaceae bacterium]|nr:class I adenylate-forming enzyme family protein [Magnetospirillaceae bacterium]
MTLASIFDWAQSQPEKPALIFHDQVFSYATLARIIERATAHLSAAGVPRGGTVAVMVNNLADAWVIVLALRRLGPTTISVISADSLAGLGLTDLSAIVTTTAESAYHALPGALFPGVPRYVVGGDIYQISGAPVPPPLQAPSPGGHVIYTSGTTGRFKRVLIDGPDEIATAKGIVAMSGITPATIHHGVDLGIRTAAGYRVPLAIWHAGGTVVFDQRPDRFRRFFSRPVTQAYLPGPWVREMVAAYPNGNPQPGFRLAFTSGFLSPALADDMAARFGAQISVIYAASELATRALGSTINGPDDLHWLSVSPGRRVEVVDERGQACALGQEGDLRIRLQGGDATAYVGDPIASAAAFRDGWFHPGDRAVARADGRIRILGRIADLLNIDGRKVAAAAVELELQRQLNLGDTEICVFSGLGDDGDEEIVLAIESAGPIDTAAIAAKTHPFLRSRVRVVALPAFPRTDTRKVRRVALRDMLF